MKAAHPKTPIHGHNFKDQSTISTVLNANVLNVKQSTNVVKFTNLGILKNSFIYRGIIAGVGAKPC